MSQPDAHESLRTVLGLEWRLAPSVVVERRGWYGGTVSCGVLGQVSPLLQHE